MVKLPIGGAEQILLNTVKGIDKNRFEPLVCCIGECGAVGEEIKKAGTRVIALGYPVKRFKWSIVRDLARLMQDEHVDVLHTSLYHANFFGRIAGRIARVPVVLTWVHNAYDKSNRKLQRRIANRLLARYTDTMVAVSKGVKADILKYDGTDPGLIKVLYTGLNPIDVDTESSRPVVREQLGIPDDAFVIGNVGRLVDQKNQALLLRAFRKVVDCRPDSRLVMVGGGPLEDDLHRLAGELGISDRTIFTGWRRDVPELLSAFDVFALSSDYEGLGIVILEAMFVGLPTVATAVAGIVEAVEDSQTGILVSPGDEKALAGALLKMAGDSELRAELGNKAKAVANEKWTFERYIHELEDLYTESYSCKVRPEQLATGGLKDRSR